MFNSQPVWWTLCLSFEVLIDGSVLLENKPKKLRVVCISPFRRTLSHFTREAGSLISVGLSSPNAPQRSTRSWNGRTTWDPGYSARSGSHAGSGRTTNHPRSWLRSSCYWCRGRSRWRWTASGFGTLGRRSRYPDTRPRAADSRPWHPRPRIRRIPLPSSRHICPLGPLAGTSSCRPSSGAGPRFRARTHL